MLGVFWKIQEIFSKTGTRISKIDGEMSEIIEPKVGNPKNPVSRNGATLSHPWNLTFFEDDIFQLFSYFYGLKVPKWNYAHILLCKKAKNIRKTPKNTCFTAPWLRTTLLNDPVWSVWLIMIIRSVQWYNHYYYSVICKCFRRYCRVRLCVTVLGMVQQKAERGLLRQKQGILCKMLPNIPIYPTSLPDIHLSGIFSEAHPLSIYLLLLPKFIMWGY